MTRQRIMTFEEFMATTRSPREVESYHTLLAHLRRLGAVDEDLNVIPRRKRKPAA